ncbi:FAD/NAD-P-binding domain-containing protein [Meredithblackwellia eburnea MCA 4105]
MTVPLSPRKLFESPAWPHSNERGYTLPDQPMGTARPLKVIAVGGGMSGICLAHSIATEGQGIELDIYEMGAGYGGTWFWNTYPGVRCDIPSVNYQMSFSPKPDWPEFYATGGDIQEYYEGVVHKFSLEKYFHLSHEVVGADWLTEESRWRVKVRGPDGAVFTNDCDVLFNVGGVLNLWKWPNIKGLHSFKGDLCHTARWPKGLDAKGKRIAVIGSGSSGIQLLAHVQPEAEQVFHWIRSPTWITAAFAQDFAGVGGKNYKYTDEHKAKFAADPVHGLKYRKMMESELNKRFKFIVQGTPEQKRALEFADADMRQKLKGNQRLIDALVPTKFVVGCRRPTPGNGYLEALNEPNVQVYTEMFQQITEKGFLDAEGNEVEVDIVACATGFDTTYKPSFPVIANGVNLQDKWNTYPTDTYMSTSVAGYPNYLMYFGPFGPTGHGSGAPVIEAYTRYAMKFLKKLQTEGIKTFTVKDKAAADFNEHAALYLKRTAWAGNCSSWFKPGPDVPPVMFPGNRVLFMEMMHNPRFEDFDYEYEKSYVGNRFGYFGNGFTMREEDGRDTTYYYGLLDGKDEQPDYEDIRPLYVGLS